MQAIKDKITDMKELHKAKAEAREVEKVRNFLCYGILILQFIYIIV